MAILPIEQEYGRHIDPIVDGEDESPDLPDLPSMTQNPDGSIDFHDDDEDQEESGFLDNLAEILEDGELRAIASDLLEKIEIDRGAREARDKQYAEGIKRTGLGSEAPGGADFEGASKAVHPVLAEGCVDFAARAIKEIYPPSGACKTQIIGKVTDEKLAKAERKKQYMNWQLTTQIAEYRDEKEQELTQLPLGGSQYMKWYYDPVQRRPRVEFIPIDHFLLPFSVTHFYSAHRATHQQLISRQTFEKRIESGLYLDVRYTDPGQDDLETKAQKASNKIEGKEELFYNEDGLRTVYEIYVDYDISVEKGVRPYIISIDEATSEVLAIYRNWDEEDESHKKLDWVVEDKFIPWRGAYGIGLPHLIGSLAGALTGALRALLDSAHINTSPSLVKLKGGRNAGESISIDPGTIAELEGVAGVDDIRKMIMPMPYNQPSPVLFQLLDWITNQAKGVVGTAEERIADAGNNMPMGTALALIEQGSVTYSAIHGRLHAAQKKSLEILHRINSKFLDDEETIEELGDLIVRREDFQGPMDIIPVSDPNIFSDAQRYAQLQAVMQLADKYPQLYDEGELNKRALALLNYPNAEDILKTSPDAQELDPIMENYTAAEGKQPLKVYDDQDDLTHMMTHLHFMTSPIFAQNPMMNGVIGPLMAHVKDHFLAFYKKEAQAAVAATAQVTGTSEDQAHSVASGVGDAVMAQKLAPVMQMMQQVQQYQQQNPPSPPPLDPQSQVALQLGQAKIQAQTQQDQAVLAQEGQLAQAKMQAEAQEKQAQMAFDQQVQQAQSQKDMIEAQQNARDAELAAQTEAVNAHIKAQTDLQMNEQDNRTAMLIETMKEQQQAQIEQNNHVRDMLSMIKDQGTPNIDLTPIKEMMSDHVNALNNMMGHIKDLGAHHVEMQIAMQKLSKPKRVIRDANGDIVGLHTED